MKIPLPRTLHMRILLAIAALQLLVVGLFSIYLIAQEVSNQLTSRQELGHKMLALAVPAVEHMVSAGDQVGLERYLSRIAADPIIGSISVKDAQGKILFSKETSLTLPHPVVTWFNSSSLLATMDAELKSGNGSIGMISLGLSNKALNEKVTGLLHNVLYLFLILLAADLIASELVIKVFVSPLGPLTVMAMDVSQGNLDTTIRPSDTASDEVKNLANAFIASAKVMRSQIKDLEDTRTQLAQNELRLRNLVNNMREVLVELDKEGHILFLNPVWESLTGYRIHDSLNKPFGQYLIKPQYQSYFTPENLEQLSLYDLQLEFRTQDGNSVWMQMNTTLQYDEKGKFSGIVSTLEDISETRRLQKLQQAHEQDLYRLTITDPLTGVYNRRHFDELLTNLLSLNLGKGRQLALIIIDVDGFKFINDTYGHPVGDEVLKTLANTLKTGKHQGGAVARLAGDEFAVVLQNASEEEAAKVARQIHENINAIVIPLAVGELRIQTSIGVAVAPIHGKTPQDLVRAVDVALYHAKKSGRNRVDTLSKDVGEAIMDIFSQGFELRNALKNGMIAPFMQPIVNITTGEIMAYEVLTRLKRGNKYIPADEFVLIAEDLGLIREMDLFIIREAISAVPPNFPLFVNISLGSFYTPEFSQELKSLLQAAALAGRTITVEFTERQTTNMSGDFLNFISELRAEGCKIALDDFGAGYSTYSYLSRLRPDYVKIDGGFVQRMLANQEDAKIVEQIKELSEIFGACSIAEHVENESTLMRLREMGVHCAQGYLLGKPRPIMEYLQKESVNG